jgi:hypothetical protein
MRKKCAPHVCPIFPAGGSLRCRPTVALWSARAMMKTRRGAIVVVWILVVATGSAHADEAVPACRDVHTGISMRTALGTHQYRLEFGGRWNRFESIVVLDPNSSRDGQTDLDLLAMYWFKPAAWALFAGWRNTAFNLLGENRWHENLLLGIDARLPSLGPRWIRYDVGAELVVDVVRHGSNVPPEWISFSSERHFNDLVHIALFARVQFVVSY